MSILEIKQNLSNNDMPINQLKEIYIKCSKFLKNMKEDYKLIFNSILHKSLSKLQNKSYQKFLEEKNLFSIEFTKFEENTHRNFVEYTLNISDNILNKTWSFQTRFSKLYEFHKNLEECFIFGENKDLINLFCSKKLFLEMPDLPEFPEKSWIENKEYNFLNLRMKKFENYFQELLFSGKYREILDSGMIYNFFYESISVNYNNNEKLGNFEMKEWKEIKFNVN